MDIIIGPLFNLIHTLISLYLYVLLASIIMSWLIAFSLVNTNNHFISMINGFLFRVTEPALDPIRKRLPDLGGLDISPVILILAIYFVRDVLSRLMIRLGGFS
ncbi:MAG: YggT family protein [Alphaproteobacteria bacterium]|nr:YggT family protein [Alphaproteobacteria bacterium]